MPDRPNGAGRRFFDADPEEADGWRIGTGGGLWISFLKHRATLSAAMMEGEDHVLRIVQIEGRSRSQQVIEAHEEVDDEPAAEAGAGPPERSGKWLSTITKCLFRAEKASSIRAPKSPSGHLPMSATAENQGIRSMTTTATSTKSRMIPSPKSRQRPALFLFMST